VKLNTLQTANPERCKPVVVFQVPELPFHGSATPVEVGKPFRVSSDAREVTTAERKRQSDLLSSRAAQRDNGFAASFLTLGIDPGDRSPCRR
jgi:hypothetical protein